VPADEQVTDEQWRTDAGQRGEVVFMKDDRVRYNVAEKAAIKRHRIQCFCLARQDLGAEEMAARFLRSIVRIEAACGQDGPFVYSVQMNRIVELHL
jgi:hypothetical protein